jgi:hypothetical protein
MLSLFQLCDSRNQVYTVISRMNNRTLCVPSLTRRRRPQQDSHKCHVTFIEWETVLCLLDKKHVYRMD